MRMAEGGRECRVQRIVSLLEFVKLNAVLRAEKQCVQKMATRRRQVSKRDIPDLMRIIERRDERLGIRCRRDAADMQLVRHGFNNARTIILVVDNSGERVSLQKSTDVYRRHPRDDEMIVEN